MRKKNYKGRCEKQALEKFTTICKTYDPIQTAYANILVENKDISEVRCNVILDGECSEYMTDFVCKKTDGDLMVRECISTKLLEKPLSISATASMYFIKAVVLITIMYVIKSVCVQRFPTPYISSTLDTENH